MDNDRREEFIAALIAKGATKPCARCGTQHFAIVAETAIAATVADALLPVVLVACTHCGLVSPFALAYLGVKPKAEGLKPFKFENRVPGSARPAPN